MGASLSLQVQPGSDERRVGDDAEQGEDEDEEQEQGREDANGVHLQVG